MRTAFVTCLLALTVLAWVPMVSAPTVWAPQAWAHQVWAHQVWAQSSSDREAVLAANQEFYRAFRDSDRAGMDAVWARRGPVAVEHPSGWRAEGRPAVMQSWVQILQRPPRIFCEVEAVSFTNARARVICMEQLNPGTRHAISVRMMNVFHQESGAWKMIYHGPVQDEAVS